MNLKSSLATRRMSSLRLLLGLTCIATMLGESIAQNVLAPITNPSDTSEFDITQSDGKSPTEAKGVNPYQLGPVAVIPRLTYAYTSADNVFSDNGSQRDTGVQTVTPGFLFTWGGNWNFDYSPSWRFYSDDAFEDELNHNARLSGGGVIDDWRLGLSQTYRFDRPSLIEIGQRAAQENWGTSISASRQMSQNVVLSIGANQNLRYTNRFTDTEQRGLSTSLSFHRSPTTSYSLTLAAGGTEINPGFDLDYKQISVGGSWQPTQKLGFDLQTGIDSRAFDFTGAPDIENPTFGASLRYRPFEQTSIRLSANRDVSASFFQDQISETESYRASFRQRIFGRFYLNASVNRSFNRYVGLDGDDQAGRDDQRDSYSIGLSTKIRDKITLSGSYRFSDNSSNTNLFNYESNQYTLQASYQY